MEFGSANLASWGMAHAAAKQHRRGLLPQPRRRVRNARGARARMRGGKHLPQTRRLLAEARSERRLHRSAGILSQPRGPRVRSTMARLMRPLAAEKGFQPIGEVGVLSEP